MTSETAAEADGRPLSDLDAQGLTHAIEADLFALTGLFGFFPGLEVHFMTHYGYHARRPFQNYLARLDGRTVGVMSVFAGAGVAGIYNVAVLPEARRQGVADGLLLAVLRDLPAAGFRAAILHSTPMGYNLYRRLGFEEYCTIGRYLWQPPAA